VHCHSVLGHGRSLLEESVAVLAFVGVLGAVAVRVIVTNGQPVHHVRGLPLHELIHLLPAPLPALAASTHLHVGSGVRGVPEKLLGLTAPAELLPGTINGFGLVRCHVHAPGVVIGCVAVEIVETFGALLAPHNRTISPVVVILAASSALVAPSATLSRRHCAKIDK